MLLKVYGIKNCDSVRKARRFLKASGIDYEFIDFRETPVSETEIRQWLQ
jgi:arsenate reductase-like glutaredoxin family protein